MSVDDLTYYDVGGYNLAKLVRDVGAPLIAVLRAIYGLQREGEFAERWASVNPGCTPRGSRCGRTTT